MSFLLFASNRYYPQCGVRDLVGCYPELTDQVIFDAVAAQVKSTRLDADDRLHVNALDISGGAAGLSSFWEFRMATSLGSPALQFASLTAFVDDVGVCGLVPLTCVEGPNPNDAHNRACHQTLDPKEEQFWN